MPYRPADYVVTHLAWSDNLFLQEDTFALHEFYPKQENEVDLDDDQASDKNNLFLTAACLNGQVAIWRWDPQQYTFHLDFLEKLFEKPGKIL